MGVPTRTAKAAGRDGNVKEDAASRRWTSILCRLCSATASQLRDELTRFRFVFRQFALFSKNRRPRRPCEATFEEKVSRDRFCIATLKVAVAWHWLPEPVQSRDAPHDTSRPAPLCGLLQV